MAKTEIKLDINTLPKDKQLIKWQTHQDMENKQWKTGKYIQQDAMFLVHAGKWDYAWEVIHWEEVISN